MATLRLKVDMPAVLIVDVTESVRVATTEDPAARLEPSLSHVKVIGPSADAGFHPEVVMFKVIGTVPVFLT
jgi:hypothetical protein